MMTDFHWVTLQEEFPKLVEAVDNFILYKAATGGGGARVIPPGPNNYMVEWLRTTAVINNSVISRMGRLTQKWVHTY